MNEIAIFNNPEFGGDLRTTVEPNGKVLFCGNDVARALGYKNPRSALQSHCKGVVKRDGVSFVTNQFGKTTEMTVETNFIPEGDVYRLIIRSTLPGAERFERWVFDEVLPTLHHTGTYTIEKPMSPAELLAAQANLLVEMEQKVAGVEAHTLALEEKVDNAVKVFSRPAQDHWKTDMSQAIKELCHTHKLSIPATTGRMYDELEQAAGCQINARLSRLRARKRKAGATYREAAALNKLDAVAGDKHLRSIFEGIVRRWQAEYCNK